MATIYDIELYLLALERCLLFGQNAAGVTSLTEIETEIATLRSQYDTDPNAVTNEAIYSAIIKCERIYFPALDTLLNVFVPRKPQEIYMPEIQDNADKYLLILAMQGVLEHVYETANIQTLGDLESRLQTLRTRYNTDAASVTQGDLSQYYDTVMAAQFPSIYRIHRIISSNIVASATADGSLFADGSVQAL